MLSPDEQYERYKALSDHIRHAIGEGWSEGLQATVEANEQVVCERIFHRVMDVIDKNPASFSG